MKQSWVVGAFLFALGQSAFAAEQVSAHARQVHEDALVLDTHLDTPANLGRPGWNIADDHANEGDMSQVDLPRMKSGGLDGGFWVIYTAQGARDEAGKRTARNHGLARLVAIREMLASHPDAMELALTSDDALRIAKAGKRVSFISMENAAPLAADPSLLEVYHGLGLRMLGITHVLNNDFGDSSTDAKGPEWGGLSPAGRALVAEANRLGILLDASHASDAVFDQLLEVSRAPIVLSHTSADAVFDHPRNIDDDRIRRLAKKGGVIHVNAFGGYLVSIPKVPEREAALDALSDKYGPESRLSVEAAPVYLAERREIEARYPVRRATLDDYMSHLLHIIKVAGVDHVGVGADWDGGGGVEGMEDVGALPLVTARLLAAGYGEDDVRKIWGENLLRVLREAQSVAEPSAKP
ncbi:MULTISPECIES: dipeptidase [unclassified Pseudoxanthomonas]|uniref:dipeptidase n=1 Tax=unclassified Pseudoxanthomonas TaxID=2645906 RepID=UPI0008ECA32E|nr:MULTISPECIES: dipeptidase [unclassified Pseudoxanthomonas]PPJ41231.1 membrane dipeptidase [Pseudoxanthomonas sp. KAs_5_3]SFV30883.1 membrane dipeptidase [Pseudoxanthomonas sp. YR558]